MICTCDSAYTYAENDRIWASKYERLGAASTARGMTRPVGRASVIKHTRLCSISACDKPVRARGWCTAHYTRWVRHGDPLTILVKFPSLRSRSLADRFWEKVERGSGCWEWQGGTDARGYGQINIANRPQKAHRVAWQLTNGEIPSAMFVCHHCDNPSCVRPDHLFLGNAKDNNLDMRVKGRNAFADYESRFFSMIDKGDGGGCWQWTGRLSSDGIGHIMIRGKNTTARRLAYELFVEPVAEGLRVFVSCENTACVRPDHLYLGTRSHASALSHVTRRANGRK